MRKVILCLLLTLSVIIGLIVVFQFSYSDLQVLQLADLIIDLEYDEIDNATLELRLKEIGVSISNVVRGNLEKEYIKESVQEIDLTSLYETFPPDARVQNPTDEYDKRIFVKDGRHYISLGSLVKDDEGVYPVIFKGGKIYITEWDIYGERSVTRDSIEGLYRSTGFEKDRNVYKVQYKSILTNSKISVNIEVCFNKITNISVKKG